jgi:hypothetical protein
VLVCQIVDDDFDVFEDFLVNASVAADLMLKTLS